ncbi:hypothetical protein [Aquincola sp. J276]|uniref:hypothetical protein n=1 Tax=Aquincola sp. J276 TaxID=2898432 RepID=UPI002151E0B8|nr:hypothetical protein [Aquincola sp. J276]MCR5867135.1 hypothetical protein [Aquincola sp. J276]
MSLHALSTLSTAAPAAAARLSAGHGSAAVSAPTIEQWLLADDGVGGLLLQAGPRSARLSIDAMERQFAAALLPTGTEAGR